MYSHIDNIVNSLPNNSIPETFNSFDQCNKSLYDIHNIDLDQYCEITHQIQFDAELIQYIPNAKTKWLRSVLNMFIRYAKHDVRDFVISVSELTMLGIDMNNYLSKIPQWMQHIFKKYDDNVKRELRFLKKNKLRSNVDFILITGDIDNEMIIIGYRITRIALYRLITNIYGSKFLESIIARMCQILYFFDDYKRVNHIRHIERLEDTILKLSNDIESIRSHSSNILKLDDYDRNSFNYYLDNNEDMPHEDVQNIKVIHRRLTDDSNDKCNYKNDDIYSIHSMIETSMNRVDTRMSELHLQLANIMTKIDNIVSTTDFAQRHSSVASESLSDDIFNVNGEMNDEMDDEVDDEMDDEIGELSYVKPVDKICTRSFIGRPPPECCSNMRNTCIGNEHQF